MSYQRKQEDKRRLTKLYNDVFAHRRWVCSGVITHREDGRYYKVYRGRRSKKYKKIFNKKLRHYDDIPNYGGYKKCTDFWWEIW